MKAHSVPPLFQQQRLVFKDPQMRFHLPWAAPNPTQAHLSNHRLPKSIVQFTCMYYIILSMVNGDVPAIFFPKKVLE
ncbi:hypothetical protein Y032_0097g3030 [Ancylostoma ceylanicum]|uniref:Uncharacterized protein n=1 Tax=Ancylostoma ceylanicum TaxID=53326 RepID=A0A016TJS3_9BILA|nr:hypothetical protein Y032_0097g3030 [Ancylostoma ceylanicum]